MAGLSGVLLGLTFLCRTIGIVWILTAILLFLFVRRKALFPFAVAGLTPVILWFSWTHASLPEVFDPLFEYYLTYIYDWVGIALPDIPRILSLNVLWTFRGLAFNLFFGPIVILSLATLQFMFLEMLVTILALNYSVKLILAGRILPLFLMIYFIPIIVHPWPPSRFIIPVSLLGGAFFLSEASHIMKRLWPRRILMPLGLIAVCIASNVVILVVTHLNIREYRYPAFFGGTSPHWKSFEAGFRWIRSNTPEDAIIAAGLDPMVWLYTNRRSFRYYNQKAVNLFYNESREKTENPHQILDNLHRIGASYLFMSPQYGFAIDKSIKEQVASIANQLPPTIVPVFTSGDGEVIIYRIVSRTGSL